MSIVHCAEVEPQVLAALHMLSGCTSSHVYLPFFCACAVGQFTRTMQDNSSNELQMLNCCRVLIVRSATAHVRRLRFREGLTPRLNSCPRVQRPPFQGELQSHSMMLTSFHSFWLSSHCNSPSLLMISCVAGKRTPPLLSFSLSFMLISPAVRLKLFVWVSQ
jgi:hypothetical protein